MAQPAHAQSPADALAARLDDPATASALNDLLDHVDLLALLVTGLSGFLSRGDTIADTLAEGVADIRRAERPAGADLASILDVTKKFAALAPPLIDKLPVLEALLNSDLADPRLIEIASTASRAAVRGADQAQDARSNVSGLRALLRAMRDDDIGRALGWIFSVAKALGQELKDGDRPRPV